MPGEEANITRWNFLANVGDGALYALAQSLVSQQTVLPVFVKEIGGSNISIGMIPVLWTFGFNFPQIFVARFVQKHERKRELFLKTALIQRLPWLLLAILSFLFLNSVSRDVALGLFFVGFALAAVAGSLNLPVWFDLIAKLTPVRLRGRLFAVRSMLGAVLGILGGGLVTYVLASFAFPTSFGILFFVAFCLTMVSYLFLTKLKEVEQMAPAAGAGRPRVVQKMPRILMTRRNFRNYLVADALLITAGVGNAFFTVNAFQRFSLSNAYAGAFTVAIMVGMIGGSLLFGYLADRFGHKVNLVISGVAMAVACLVALLAENVETYMLAFVVSALALSISGISRLPMIAELCTEAERPSYIAMANLITSPFILFGVVAGWLANLSGYGSVFLIAGSVSLCAVFWLTRMVEEPRNAGFKPGT